MSPTIYAFLLTTLAGLSTMLGTLIIFLKKTKKEKIIIGSLSFAAGVMITVSLTDLIPEAYELLIKNYERIFTILLILIFINIGLLISMELDKYLPNNNKDGLYRVGIISMLVIIMHNIPEGMATFMASNTDLSLGITLTLAIALHNIPEGISISVPIYYSTKNKTKALLYTFISGLSELFGAIITYLFLKPYMNDLVLGCLFAIIAGIMIQISFYELIPTSLKYNNKKLSLIFIFIGIIIMIINSVIF